MRSVVVVWIDVIVDDSCGCGVVETSSEGARVRGGS